MNELFTSTKTNFSSFQSYFQNWNNFEKHLT